MKLSVIIPAYNSEKYITRCLDSIKSQQGAELEIIVVNDGSKDSTEEILKTYPGITFVTIPNGGAANARNTGLRMATGDFVMFLDADDFLKEGCLEKVFAKQQEKNADIVRFSYLEYYEGGKTLTPLNTFREEIWAEKEEFKKKIYPYYINGIMLNSICMTLFKREVLEGVSFRTDMPTAEDAIFSLCAYTNAQNALIIPDEYYMYNRGDGESLTSKGLSLMKKYRCNFILSGEIAKKLPRWKMNSMKWYIKTYLRPIVLTFDKLKRNKRSKAVGNK